MSLLDRTGLIDLVARKTTLPAVRRACLTGKVEVLGGFSEACFQGDPCWIVRVTARHGTEYLVAVTPYDDLHSYSVGAIGEIPWHNWVGTRVARERYSVYAGDHPARYDVLRDFAIERREARRSVLL